VRILYLFLRAHHTYVSEPGQYGGRASESSQVICNVAMVPKASVVRFVVCVVFVCVACVNVSCDVCVFVC